MVFYTVDGKSTYYTDYAGFLTKVGSTLVSLALVASAPVAVYQTVWKPHLYFITLHHKIFIYSIPLSPRYLD